MKGNYGDAVKIALENINSAGHDKKKDQLLINIGVIQCFQEVNFYEQSEILLAPIVKDFNLVKNKRTYGSAEVYLLHAYNLFALKKYDEATVKLEKALDKIKSADFLILKNKIYSCLAKNYLMLQEKAKHIAYQQKYNDSQNTIDENRSEAIRNIMNLSQGFQTQSYHSYTAKRQQQIYVSLGTAFFIMILIVFFNYQERQKKKMLEKQILFLENQTLQFARKEITTVPPLSITSKKPLWIPKEKEDQLLQKLRDFENSDQFLEKNMSLPLLAAQFETNTKYLSEIIKKFKDKNYNTYINELKINHIAHLISSDLTFGSTK